MLGLTPLEETVAGKELIQLGEQKGRKIGRDEGLQEGIQEGIQKGKQQSIMQLLTARFGAVSPSIQARISAVSEMATLDQLFSDALTFTSIELFEKALPK